MTWRETKYYDTPSLSISPLLEKMPGNIISTSIVCCRNIISHFPHCLTPQSSHLTPHTSYLFNFRRARPGGVRPNPGAVGVDGVGWDGDDEKGEAAEAVGERCHCVALSLSLSLSLLELSLITTTSLPGHTPTDWAQWEAPHRPRPLTCVLLVEWWSSGGLRTSHLLLNCLNINWIVQTEPIKIPPLIQDTLQHALMCIEVLAVAGTVNVLALTVGPSYCSHVSSVVLVIKIRFTQ